MIYQVSAIERDVRVALDENEVSTQLVQMGDVDTLALNDIIRSKIVEAVRRVELAAPAHLLEEGHDFSSGIYWNGDGSGWVLLPDDFMRLIAFRMSDWERTVYEAISVDDPLYAKQSSRYKGIRGNVQKPVCAIVNRAEGKALEFYACKDNTAMIVRAGYLPYPSIDANDGIDISQRCYEAVIYTIAALVAATYGDSEKTTNLNELSKTLIG